MIKPAGIAIYQLRSHRRDPQMPKNHQGWLVTNTRLSGFFCFWTIL